MTQQKSITFFFRKKREFSDVDENDDVTEVTRRRARFSIVRPLSFRR